MGLNINLNSNITKGKGLLYPTEGLQVELDMSTYEDGGTTYYRNKRGIDIPLVSGTGIDAILDFSVLNDDRFDKGSYIGNSFGLPEYYNFPYVNIYYDSTSEATRYHWKLTDFHYANFLEQSLTVDNIAFLKAKATTNTSNVISSVSELFIYSTALVDNNLIKVKNYIGIQADFYGDELIFDVEDLSTWVFQRIIVTKLNDNEYNFLVTEKSSSGQAINSFVMQDNVLYRIRLQAKRLSGNSSGTKPRVFYDSFYVDLEGIDINNIFTDYSLVFLAGRENLYIALPINSDVGAEYIYKNVHLEKVFKNYYKS